MRPSGPTPHHPLSDEQVQGRVTVGAKRRPPNCEFEQAIRGPEPHTQPDPENRHSIYNESSLAFNSLSKLSTCEATQDRSGHQFRFTAVTRSPQGRGCVKDMKQSHLSNYLLTVKRDNQRFQSLSPGFVLESPKSLPTCNSQPCRNLCLSCKFPSWIYLQLIPKEESQRYFNLIPEIFKEAGVLQNSLQVFKPIALSKRKGNKGQFMRNNASILTKRKVRVMMDTRSMRDLRLWQRSIS